MPPCILLVLTTALKNLRAIPRQQQLLAAVAVLTMAGLSGWLVQHWGVEETDNAQLEAHLVEISSRIPGTVLQVAVQDDQQVRAGQVLVVLDPRDAAMGLRRAVADLDEARLQARALSSQTQSSRGGAAAARDQAQADALVARSELKRTGAELERLEFLLR